MKERGIMGFTLEKLQAPARRADRVPAIPNMLKMRLNGPDRTRLGVVPSNSLPLGFESVVLVGAAYHSFRVGIATLLNI